MRVSGGVRVVDGAGIRRPSAEWTDWSAVSLKRLIYASVGCCPPPPWTSPRVGDLGQDTSFVNM